MTVNRSSHWKQWLLIASITLATAACSPQSPPSATTATPAAPVLADIAGTPARPPQEGRTTIVWQAPSTWANLDYVLAAFEADHPDIHVEIDQVDLPALAEVAEQALAQQQATPDVVTLEASLSAHYGFKGWLEPLWNAFTFDQKQDWVRASRLASMYNQERYSAPLTTSSRLLFYNSDLLGRGRVKPPPLDDPWTWEQVLSAAEKLTTDEDGDGAAEVRGFAWEASDLAQLASMAQSRGAAPIGDDGLTVEGSFDSQAWASALAFCGELFEASDMGSAPEDFDAVESFVGGNLALLVGQASNIHRFAGALGGSGLSFGWGVSPHPHFKKGEAASPVGGWHLGVNANSLHQDAAKSLVVWLTTGEGAEMVWRHVTPGLPAQKTTLAYILQGPEFEAPPWSYLRVAAAQATDNMGLLPLAPGYAHYDALFQSLLGEIRGSADPEAASTQVLEMLTLMAQDGAW